MTPSPGPTTRVSWSPTRTAAALECGRRLQAMTERWPASKPHIRGVRGQVVHQYLHAWESSGRDDSLTPAVFVPRAFLVAAGEVIQDEATLNQAVYVLDLAVKAVALVDTLRSLEQAVIADIVAATPTVKRPKATKAYDEAMASGAPAQVAGDIADLTARIDEAEARLVAEDLWPWQGRSFVNDAVIHSMDTATSGRDYLRRLWPSPDIVGSEWHLEADIGAGYTIHGFVDRVELLADGSLEVVDYKSSRWGDTPLDHFIQCATYAYLVSNHTGLAVDRVRLVYLREQSSDAYAVDVTWSQRLLELIQHADQRLRQRSFGPSFSGCGICPYYGHCAADFRLTPIQEGTP